MENIRQTGFLVSIILCLISIPLYFLVCNENNTLDWIELIYLVFTFGFMFFAYLFSVMNKQLKEYLEWDKEIQNQKKKKSLGGEE